MENSAGSSSSSSGEGGRAPLPNFGISKEVLCILLIVFLLADLGRLFTPDAQRNVDIIVQLVQDHPSLRTFGITEESIRVLNDFLGGITNFLLRPSRGRPPDMNIRFDDLAPEMHDLLHPTNEDLPLEDIMDNFRQITMFIADREEVFTAPTYQPRILENVAILTAHFTPSRSRRFQPAAAARLAAPNPGRRNETMERIRTGFGYMERSEIPITRGEPLHASRTDATCITAQPGFASAFHRALTTMRLRAQLSDFFARHSAQTRELTVHNGAFGICLQNRGIEAIPAGSVCNFYSGFFTPCHDGDRDQEPDILPSDRIIEQPFVFTSNEFLEEITDPHSRRHATTRPPSFVQRYVKFYLVGWGGAMVRRLPDGLRSGAEFASHSCDPNSFLHHGNLEDEDEPFRASGSFYFPHTVEFRGRKYRFNRLDFTFKPYFIHTKTDIQVGGFASIDYGSDIVDYSRRHIINEANRRESRCSTRVTNRRLERNEQNSRRLAAAGIEPIPCMCEVCNDLQRGDETRSKLYFDGNVDSIDYEALASRMLTQQAEAEPIVPEDTTVREPIRRRKRTRQQTMDDNDKDFVAGDLEGLVIPLKYRPQRKKQVVLKNSASPSDSDRSAAGFQFSLESPIRAGFSDQEQISLTLPDAEGSIDFRESSAFTLWL